MNRTFKTIAMATVAVASLATTIFANPFGGKTPVGTKLDVWPTGVDTLVLTPVNNTTAPYWISNYFKIPRGKVLKVLPGTWIYGLAAGNGSQSAGSNLVICRGGKMFAEGTVDSPIVFTAFGDDVRSPNAMGPGAMELWGGILMIGQAGCSWDGPYTTENPIVGDTDFNFNLPSDTFPHDCSGRFHYVSVRHGGGAATSFNDMDLWNAWGVGDSTIMDHCEVFSGEDDGFEFFGGTLSAKYLVASNMLEENFETYFGWRGKFQFLLGVKKSYESQRGEEWYGYRGNETQGSPNPGEMLKSLTRRYMAGLTNNVLHAADGQYDSTGDYVPHVENATLIGNGSFDNRNNTLYNEGLNKLPGSKSEMVLFANTAYGIFNNNILTHTGRVPPIYRGLRTNGSQTETQPFGQLNTDTTTWTVVAGYPASYSDMNPDHVMILKHNVFWDFTDTNMNVVSNNPATAYNWLCWGVHHDFTNFPGTPFDANHVNKLQQDVPYLMANDTVADPELRGVEAIWKVNSHTLDPRPNPYSFVLNYHTPVTKGTSWFTPVNYCGAFDGTNLWCAKWTALADKGILVDETVDNRGYGAGSNNYSVNSYGLNVAVTPATSSRIYINDAVNLRYEVEIQPGWSVNASSPNLHFWVDGLELTSTILSSGSMGSSSDINRLVWQVPLASASILGTTGVPTVGSHVLRVSMPVSNGTVSTVLDGASNFNVYQ